MIQRLLNIIESLKTNKRIKDSEITTTIDDMSEGRRISFKREQVERILAESEKTETGLVEKLLSKSGLLYPSEEDTELFNKHDTPEVKKDGEQ